jgi:hypothetical protein
VRSALLARWLLDVHRRGGWGALERSRPLHGPGGVTLEWRYLDRLDEVQDVDLARGVRTHVDAAFRSSAERLGEALETLNPYEERFMNETTPTVRRIPHGDNEYVVSYLHEEST